jgi:hypothetical protein
LRENSGFTEFNIFKTLLGFANKPGQAYSGEASGKLIRTANQCLRDDNYDALEKITQGSNAKIDPDLDWNVENFLKVCNDSKSKIDWKKVFTSLDSPDLYFTSQNAFNQLFEYFKV